MDSFVGDDNYFVSHLVLPSVSSLAPIMFMSMPIFLCVSVLFPSFSDSSSISSMEFSQKDLSSPSDISSSYRKSSTCLLAFMLFFLYCFQIMFSLLTSLLKMILLVRLFKNLYKSFVWSSAYPTNMHVFPLSSNSDLIFLPSCMAVIANSPNVLKLLVYFVSSP